jgi:signal transduction histidine kinase
LRRAPPPRAVPLAILVGGMLFTLAISALIAAVIHDRDQARFERAVLGTSDLIDRRLDLYLVTLRGAAGFFAASDTVSADEFRAYIARLGVQHYYPGIQGVGWTERIEAGLDEAGEFTERHAIRFLEPLDERNRAALGYDMYSESTRRAAMSRARDDAAAALSGRVRLVQEIIGPEQPGFLLYVPVYEGGEPPDDLAERRATLKGFVYSPFRAVDLFEGILGFDPRPRVSFSVFDGTAVDPEQLLYGSPRVTTHRPALSATRHLVQAGRPWTVTFESTPDFEAGSLRMAPWAVLLAGLATSLGLFFLARGQARARVEAEEANLAKSRFLATMSHELRTPLNAIAGYVDLLVLEVPGPLTDKQHHFLSRVAAAQGHLLTLIDDILSFAKLEAGRTEIRLESLNVEALVADAETLVEAVLAASDLTYVVEGGPPATVLADPEKARQILVNLLSNAAKFTDPGGRVSVGWESDGAAVCIHVSDTGVGIARAQQAAVFDPFVQVDADLTRTRQGTGLGLAISRQLARVMDGEIRVESMPGHGSTFTLVLPQGNRQATG